jgi:citrate lyase beta subunit
VSASGERARYLAFDAARALGFYVTAQIHQRFADPDEVTQERSAQPDGIFGNKVNSY